MFVSLQVWLSGVISVYIYPYISTQTSEENIFVTCNHQADVIANGLICDLQF